MIIKKAAACLLILAMLAGCALADTINADSDSETIAAMQEQLHTLQLLTDAQVTGEWNDDTVHAVLLFQRFVNKVNGEGSLEETGECDDATAGFLEFAAGKGWNVAEQVKDETVLTPEEQAAQAEAEAEAAAQAEAEKQKADEATIAYVQTMLRHVGLIDEVTGTYDDGTKDAIMRAQRYINAQEGEGTVEENGAYDDPETLAWLNKASEEDWQIPRTDPTPELTPEPGSTAEAEAEGEDGEAKETPVPQGIYDFTLTCDGIEATAEPMTLEAGEHEIAWTGENVAMFSMYMYDGDGNMVNKNEGMSQRNMVLNTLGMSSGVVYEIRIGAVPNGGQVADMEWRSLYLQLK